ncbi:hypothetical protein GCM10023223_48110 [Stackebrandtia albiflava]
MRDHLGRQRWRRPEPEPSVVQTGAWLRTSAGTWVQATAIGAYETRTHTYNLTVATFHTYYVQATDDTAP